MHAPDGGSGHQASQRRSTAWPQPDRPPRRRPCVRAGRAWACDIRRASRAAAGALPGPSAAPAYTATMVSMHTPFPQVLFLVLYKLALVAYSSCYPLVLLVVIKPCKKENSALQHASLLLSTSRADAA